MAVAFGTNAGFVTVAPTSDPSGGGISTDGNARATKVTTPAGIAAITEVGWYRSNTTAYAGDYEIGLYAHLPGTDLPGALIHSTNATSSGTDEGWKTQEVNWAVDPETIYWLALELDTVTSWISVDYNTTGGRQSWDNGVNTLKDPWVSDGVTDDIIAVYAKVGAGTTYSELSGTVAAVSVVENANMDIQTAIELSGTVAAVSNVANASLGQVAVSLGESVAIKRLVAVGNDRVYYEVI